MCKQRMKSTTMKSTATATTITLLFTTVLVRAGGGGLHCPTGALVAMSKMDALRLRPTI